MRLHVLYFQRSRGQLQCYTFSNRAGFTLSGALFRKKCGAPSPIFSSKKLATFLVKDHCPRVSCQSPEKLFLLITLVNSGESPIISVFPACIKFAAPFCRGPCLAEHAEHA